jgi:GNAT superfamily N-acetyltransferase
VPADQERRADIVIAASDAETGPDGGTIERGLADALTSRFGVAETRPFLITAKRDGRLLGGARGVSHWRWLYVRQLYVEAPCRGQGLGSRLLSACRDEARHRHCVGLYIDSFDPDIVAFYRRRGFATTGEIADFPPGHSRVFLAQRLGEKTEE